MLEVNRAQVLAYRATVHGLESVRRAEVLDTGVQDTPPGKSAHLALRARNLSTDGLVLVHSLRGTMHWHREADVALLAAAMRESFAGAAEAEPGPVALTKGELSTAVTRLVDRQLTPWCATCGVHHPNDGLFRIATLQAGLRLRPDGVFVAGDVVEAVEPEVARRELLRRYLRVCGPATPAQLAAWTGFTTSATKRWWNLLDLLEMRVDGRRAWGLDDAVLAAAPPVATRLLPPYDPLAEIADRALIAPDPAHRAQIWRPAANPGLVLVAGEVVGVWRQKLLRHRLTIRITGFGPLQRESLVDEAEAVGASLGASSVDVILAS